MTPHLLVLNPNSTPWMTQRVAQQVRLRLGNRIEVVELTADDGPPVIDTPDTFAQGDAAAQRALRAHLAQHPETAGVMLACFGDPGLVSLRTGAGGRPVHGLAQAAMALAASRRQRFAVLTCGPAWVDLLQQRAADFGLSGWLSGVYALPVNGRELALNPARWQGELQAAARQAEQDGAQTLILGGAAFAGLQGLIESTLPVIDGIEAAVEALLSDGLISNSAAH